MIVDRSRFLKLAVALAATTSVATAACSAAPEETDGEEGATGALAQAGGACTAKSIKKPGEGSMSFYAYQEGFCFDLARHVGPPDREGVTVKWFDFIYDQCRAYSQQLQPAVAQRVQACLKKANDRRPRNAKGDPTTAFDATVMYDCGKEALWSICDEGIDGRVRARAERISLMLKQGGDSRTLAAIQKEVGAVLSGFKSAARAQLEQCVSLDAYDLYTCVEGISIGYGDEVEDFPEPDPSPAEACAPARSGGALPANACDAVMEKIRRESAAGAFSIDYFAEAHCKGYLKNFEAAAARETISCLVNTPKETFQQIYECGAIGLKKVCPDPGNVDAICKEIVTAITAVDANANMGGGVTRQCRTMLPGLKAAAKEKVKRCVPDMARNFRGFGPEYAFYSCIEGLE